MQITQTIDDSNVPSLAKRLGWTSTVLQGGIQVPNPINQDQWIANAINTYIVNEQNAGIILPAVASTQTQATQIAANAAVLNSALVSQPTKPQQVVTP